MKSINIAKETREVFISKISTIENLSHGKMVSSLFVVVYQFLFSKAVFLPRSKEVLHRGSHFGH